MTTVAVFAISIGALIGFAGAHHVTSALLWTVDRIDRLVNPRTRARVKYHEELVARFRADIEKHNAGR
jgi:hypothetical protein